MYKHDEFKIRYNRYPHYFFWTLGTSLDDTKENKKKLSEIWKSFRKKINIDSKRKGYSFNPLFYVIESGTTGNKLHYHILIDGFTPFSKVIKHWRSSTNEKSNVNYTEKKENMDIIKAINYMLKYILKGYGKYYWMGKFHSIRFKKYEVNKEPNECRTCGSHALMYAHESTGVSDIEKNIVRQGIKKHMDNKFMKTQWIEEWK